MNERGERGPSVGFSDASYIRQDDAPNTPRCYSDPQRKSAEEKRLTASLRVAGLCLVCFVLGGLLNAALSEQEIAVLPSASPEAAVKGLAGSAAISAAVHADTPPAGTADGTGRPYLGVIVQTVSCAAAEYYNQSDSRAMVPGVQIYAVDDDGPASRAGLCSGDIILRLDDMPIETAADLTRAEETLSPGEDAVLTVYRNGDYREVSVVFSALPENGGDGAGWCDFDNAW